MKIHFYCNLFPDHHIAEVFCTGYRSTTTVPGKNILWWSLCRNLGEDEIKFLWIWIPVQISLVKWTTSALWTDSSGVLYFIFHWISTTLDNEVIYKISVMVDVENIRKTILVLKSRVPPVDQMFVLAQDCFMVFLALVRQVIFIV